MTNLHGILDVADETVGRRYRPPLVPLYKRTKSGHLAAERPPNKLGIFGPGVGSVRWSSILFRRYRHSYN
ncbi:MAG: hypothetical protein ACPMAQ_07995 [Phycisphaerae bacterium]